MKAISIDTVNAHLVEAMEMLKNNTDPDASANERIDVETARAIADLGKVVIDGYKVKAQVLSIVSKTENPSAVKEFADNSGLTGSNNKLLL